jgi:hypothetical protein
MLELDRHSGPQGCRAKSIVVHPGFTNTDLQARSVRETGGCRSQRFFRAAVQRFGMTPAQGALPLLRRPPTREPLAAPCTSRAGSTGGRPSAGPLFRRSRNRDAMATLCAVSERETGITFDIKLPS